MSDTIVLIDGPHDGERYPRPPFLAPIRLPVDRFGTRCSGSDVFGFAIYVPCEPSRYEFQTLSSPRGTQFSVELADGPAKGIRSFKRPAPYLGETLALALGEDGGPYRGTGNIVGVANYLVRNDGDRWRYYFDHVDESAETLNTLELQRRKAKVDRAIRQFYESPDYRSYSRQPTDEHAQASICIGNRRANVDAMIAPVIERLWQLNLDTHGSCQYLKAKGDRPSGMAYVSFFRVLDALQFHEILETGKIDCRFKVDRVSYRTLDDDGSIPDEVDFWEIGGDVLFSSSDTDTVVAALDAEIARERNEATEC